MRCTVSRPRSSPRPSPSSSTAHGRGVLRGGRRGGRDARRRGGHGRVGGGEQEHGRGACGDERGGRRGRARSQLGGAVLPCPLSSRSRRPCSFSQAPRPPQRGRGISSRYPPALRRLWVTASGRHCAAPRARITSGSAPLTATGLPHGFTLRNGREIGAKHVKHHLRNPRKRPRICETAANPRDSRESARQPRIRETAARQPRDTARQPRDSRVSVRETGRG